MWEAVDVPLLVLQYAGRNLTLTRSNGNFRLMTQLWEFGCHASILIIIKLVVLYAVVVVELLFFLIHIQAFIFTDIFLFKLICYLMYFFWFRREIFLEWIFILRVKVFILWI